MVLKFRKIPDTSAVEFHFTETFYLSLKRYFPLGHEINFANKFQVNYKIKQNIIYPVPYNSRTIIAYGHRVENHENELCCIHTIVK